MCTEVFYILTLHISCYSPSLFVLFIPARLSLLDGNFSHVKGNSVVCLICYHVIVHQSYLFFHDYLQSKWYSLPKRRKYHICFPSNKSETSSVNLLRKTKLISLIRQVFWRAIPDNQIQTILRGDWPSSVWLRKVSLSTMQVNQTWLMINPLAALGIFWRSGSQSVNQS